MILAPITIIDGKIDVKDALKLGAMMLEEGRRFKDPLTYIAREQIVARAIREGYATLSAREQKAREKASEV